MTPPWSAAENLKGGAYSDSESESRYSAPGRCAQPECAARGLSLCAAHGECSPAWFISESESTAACGHRCLNHAVAATSRKSKTCSNSKLEVRKAVHSGRTTFRVLANYIPRFGELHSSSRAATECGHGELHFALPSGAAAAPAGGQCLNLGPADYSIKLEPRRHRRRQRRAVVHTVTVALSRRAGVGRSARPGA